MCFSQQCFSVRRSYFTTLILKTLGLIKYIDLYIERVHLLILERNCKTNVTVFNHVCRNFSLPFIGKTDSSASNLGQWLSHAGLVGTDSALTWDKSKYLTAKHDTEAGK